VRQLLQVTEKTPQLSRKWLTEVLLFDHDNSPADQARTIAIGTIASDIRRQYRDELPLRSLCPASAAAPLSTV